MKFTKLLVCIVALFFSVTVVGCSAESAEPPASAVSSSSAVTPVEQASCADVHIPKDGAHPRPEVWTAFDDESLRALVESIDGVERVANTFGNDSYLVPSIDDVEQYWNDSDRAKVLRQLSDTGRADYYIVPDDELCHLAA